jgi:nicotinate-nucleotide adenylyltransferase
VRRIGILGGTFDPIHCGHVDAGAAAQAALHLTEVFVVTASVPPHRPQPYASGYHRFAMVALAVAGRAGWRASDVELCEGGLSYTSRTLRQFHADGYSPGELFFVIGADAFADIASWKDYPSILDGSHFAVVSRPGFPAGELPLVLPQLAARMRPPAAAGQAPCILLIDASTSEVSSTAIRDRRTRGESLAGLVPDRVAQHIEQHRLYTAAPADGRAAHIASIAAADRLHG